MFGGFTHPKISKACFLLNMCFPRAAYKGKTTWSRVTGSYRVNWSHHRDAFGASAASTPSVSTKVVTNVLLPLVPGGC